ncbi:YncE family protein [Sphaerisporangium sp. TRM90804]|uniref:YncE family protein n=1 Tax=Sphaerisporangium sp. TRM90804 TaxID=3031113 RepID=UPI00244A9F2C|nr:YncE family protein [Sphaerisporangium sp. TRM90804]MDH2430730.1 YncE family protein [Sphaerisporangium sp. TRM90804]
MQRPVGGRRLAGVVLALTVAGCSGGGDGRHEGTGHEGARHPGTPDARPQGSATPPPSEAPPRGGAKDVAAQVDVYANNRPGMLSPVVAGFPSRVYVPNSEGGTVSVIDPRTYKIIRELRVGARPQHVVPSWDLKTLWVNNNDGNTLTPIDPATGRKGKPISVEDPYNLYFTPDGRTALVMAERLNRLDFRDPRTFRLRHSLNVPCTGINHADFTADGATFLASCEFSGHLVAVDLAARRVSRVMKLPYHHSMPQDVKLSPDGRTFYVADMMRGGVWLVDAGRLRLGRFVRTGAGAHGLYVSRDSRHLYVSNRGAGSVSVVSFATGKPVDTWRIPGGGSPDMGGVSADGRHLWLTGRYHGVVYVFDTRDGGLVRKIRVGAGPHGLAVYPQPGQYSLGHTGVFR